MRWGWFVLGVLAVLVGGLWTLQGFNIVGGSAMSGKAAFAVIGLIVAAFGLALVVFGARRRVAASAATRRSGR